LLEGTQPQKEEGLEGEKKGRKMYTALNSLAYFSASGAHPKEEGEGYLEKRECNELMPRGNFSMQKTFFTGGEERALQGKEQKDGPY